MDRSGRRKKYATRMAWLMGGCAAVGPVVYVVIMGPSRTPASELRWSMLCGIVLMWCVVSLVATSACAFLLRGNALAWAIAIGANAVSAGLILTWIPNT
jgi:hypothetical protein